MYMNQFMFKVSGFSEGAKQYDMTYGAGSYATVRIPPQSPYFQNKGKWIRVAGKCGRK